MVDPITPTNIDADDQNEVALLIDGERFRLWQNAELKLSMDTIDAFSFGGPFQSDIELYRKIFQPLSFKPVSVYIGGEIVFNGSLITTSPPVSDNQRVFSVSGYSLPGVLNDCPYPAEAFPIEYNDINLRDIANESAGFFDLGVQFDGEPGAVFDRVAANPGEKVFQFLIKLAHERNLIVTNSADGKLKFYVSQAEASGSTIKQGSAPFLSASPSYNAQNYFSSVTGLAPTSSSKDAENFTLNNPFLSGVKRPFVFQVQDAKSADLQSAVKSKMGRMFGDAISFSVDVQGWRNETGDLWAPDTTIIFESADAMVYNETELLIRAVSLKRAAADTARLTLVLPESYKGEIPRGLPWL